MGNALDQLFVTAKHAVVGLLPSAVQDFASLLITVATLVLTFVSLFALTVLAERKGLGRIQNRPGPNRVGPAGLLQPLADFVKMLTKEDIVPDRADALLHFLAPLCLVVPVLLSFAVLPIGRNMVAADFDAGLLYFFAAGTCVELAVFMAGWASRNKYATLGALRAIAQMISYEVPFVLAAVPVALLAGTLSLPRMVELQAVPEGAWLAGWNVFTPWGAAGCLLFFVAAAAEANRSPFDLPEGESELIAGHLIEYSGFKYALFFIGEYLGLFAASGLGITLFLGGWQPPCAALDWVPSWLWFFLKLAMCIAGFIWIRGTVPRLRADQLMGLAWKFLLPLTLLNLVLAAGWHYTRAWSFPGAGPARWIGVAIPFLVAYATLGRALNTGTRIGPRVYRFAS